jgi:hypothetical protein
MVCQRIRDAIMWAGFNRVTFFPRTRFISVTARHEPGWSLQFWSALAAAGPVMPNRSKCSAIFSKIL